MDTVYLRQAHNKPSRLPLSSNGLAKAKDRALFDGLDTNHDGVISREEFEKARTLPAAPVAPVRVLGALQQQVVPQQQLQMVAVAAPAQSWYAQQLPVQQVALQMQPQTVIAAPSTLQVVPALAQTTQIQPYIQGQVQFLHTSASQGFQATTFNQTTHQYNDYQLQQLQQPLMQVQMQQLQNEVQELKQIVLMQQQQLQQPQRLQGQMLVQKDYEAQPVIKILEPSRRVSANGGSAEYLQGASAPSSGPSMQALDPSRLYTESWQTRATNSYEQTPEQYSQEYRLPGSARLPAARQLDQERVVPGSGLASLRHEVNLEQCDVLDRNHDRIADREELSQATSELDRLRQSIKAAVASQNAQQEWSEQSPLYDNRGFFYEVPDLFSLPHQQNGFHEGGQSRQDPFLPSYSMPANSEKDELLPTRRSPPENELNSFDWLPPQRHEQISSSQLASALTHRQHDDIYQQTANSYHRDDLHLPLERPPADSLQSIQWLPPKLPSRPPTLSYLESRAMFTPGGGNTAEDFGLLPIPGKNPFPHTSDSIPATHSSGSFAWIKGNWNLEDDGLPLDNQFESNAGRFHHESLVGSPIPSLATAREDRRGDACSVQ